MIMWKPTACQTDMNMIAGMAVEVSLSQSAPSTTLKVSACRTELTRPSGWYMKRQRMETTTMEVTTGTKYIVRKKLVPRTRLLTSSAIASARADWTGTTTTAKKKVLRRDVQNSGSLNSRSRF